MLDANDRLRLFLALWPGPLAAAQAVACQSAQPWPVGSRLIPREGLHVTLHFIGDVPRNKLPDLCPRLDVSPCHLTVTLDRLELWQKGVAVLAAATVPQALLQLHRRLAERLHSLGLYVDERPYRPHMTLARKAAGISFTPVRPVTLKAVRYALAAPQQGRYPRLCWYPTLVKHPSRGQ